MENQGKNKQDQDQNNQTDHGDKTKTNKYTPQEKPFADGEGTNLDKAIDGEETDPATPTS